MNRETPYLRFKNENLTLRDELAVDRTLLANERTLLAYLRGGITLLLAGITFIHFSRHGWFTLMGVLCLPAGLVLLLLGIYRYRKMNRSITALRMKKQVR